MSILPPIGIGCYFFSNAITAFFLGSNWMDASFMIGIFGLTKPLMICYNNFLGESFRSKGFFYKSIFYQVFILSLDLILRLTIGRISLTLYIWMSVISDLVVVVVAIFILKFLFDISLLKEITSIIPSFLCCVLFMPIVFISNTYSVPFYISLAQILICATIYFAFYFIFYKKNFVNMLSYFKFERKQ
jgi:PST family polysaccharide transporter